MFSSPSSRFIPIFVSKKNYRRDRKQEEEEEEKSKRFIFSIRFILVVVG